MLEMLISPIAALIPVVPQPAQRAMFPGDVGDVAAAAQELSALIPAAVEGLAGAAMAQSVQVAADQVDQVTAAGVELDLLDEQARQAIVATSASIAEIAQECLAEILRAVMMQPLGVPVPVIAMPIAAKHYAEAEAEIQALEVELNGLADEVRNVPIPEQTQQPVPHEDTPAEVAGGSPQAQAAVDAAKSALGTPYQWGGTTPGAGLDCSGLTQWAYAQAGVDIPRTANEQAIGPQIPRDQLQPGDLAVWDGHVAMVVDEGNFIEAGDPVQISSIRENNIGMAFKGFYRPTAA